jgi:hypothetical protein
MICENQNNNINLQVKFYPELNKFKKEFNNYIDTLESQICGDIVKFKIVFDEDLFESKEKLKSYHDKYLGYSNVSFIKRNNIRRDLFL